MGRESERQKERMMEGDNEKLREWEGQERKREWDEGELGREI